MVERLGGFELRFRRPDASHPAETVKSDNGVKEDVRIVFRRGGRPAMSTTAFVILLIVVIVLGGAIGIYYPRPAQKASSVSSASTSSSSTSTTPSSTAAASSTSSSTTSTVSSNTTRAPPTLAPPLFNFTLNSGPSTILISPGSSLIYPNVYVTPLPSSNEGQAAGLNVGAGDELVVLNVVEPSGLSIHFFGTNLTNTIYEEVSAGFPDTVELQLNASASVAPGNYPITIEGSSGTESVNYSFTVQVVKYLVAANRGLFQPADLNITVGSTVYWMNISTDPNGYSDVYFKGLGVKSPGLFPCVLTQYGPTACGVFSYTFTTAGTFPYVCDVLPACGGGTIIVTG
jgi:plastocyanin